MSITSTTFTILDANLDSSMCVYEGKHFSDLTKDSTHNSTKDLRELLGTCSCPL